MLFRHILLSTDCTSLSTTDKDPLCCKFSTLKRNLTWSHKKVKKKKKKKKGKEWKKAVRGGKSFWHETMWTWRARLIKAFLSLLACWLVQLYLSMIWLHSPFITTAKAWISWSDKEHPDIFPQTLQKTRTQNSVFTFLADSGRKEKKFKDTYDPSYVSKNGQVKKKMKKKKISARQVILFIFTTHHCYCCSRAHPTPEWHSHTRQPPSPLAHTLACFYSIKLLATDL